MRLRIQTKIIFGFLVPVIFMVIAAAFGYWAFEVSMESSDWVDHTNIVIGKANLLVKLAVDAETGERGYLLTGEENFLEPFNSGTQGFYDTVAQLRELVKDNPAQVGRLQKIDNTFQSWKSEVAGSLIASRRSAPQITDELIATIEDGRGKTLMDTLRSQVNEFVQVEDQLLKTRSESNSNTTRMGQTSIVAGPAVAALLAVLIGFLLARSISRNVGAVARAAQAMTAGMLDQKISVTSKDETGDLARSFNQMSEQLTTMIRSETAQRENLQRMTSQLNETVQNEQEQRRFLQNLIQQIRDATDRLNQSSAEILASTTQQAAGASEQSAAIAETTTTVEEMKAIAEQSFQRANQVNESAQHTVSVSQNGQHAVRDMIDSMGQIKTRVEGIAENILALSEQTQQIGEIISTVNEIASQSNMLALNASVEAARAGEHGKGFAVVAAEVRSLAEQSRAATAQVKDILSEIQKATNATVMATEEGTKGVEQGVKLAYQAQTVIEQLSKVISESSQAAVQVAAGGQQQFNGIDQVARAMTNINQATMQSLASTRQTEQSAQNLNELSGQLRELITQYKN